jgi:hypothetical protein
MLWQGTACMELKAGWRATFTTPLKQASTNEKPGEALRECGGPGVTRKEMAHSWMANRLVSLFSTRKQSAPNYVTLVRADRDACLGVSCVELIVTAPFVLFLIVR